MELVSWLDALLPCSSCILFSTSLFGIFLFCKEESLLLKEKFKGLELLLELSILAVEVEVEFLCLDSGLRMVKFLPLLSVTA